MKSSMYADRVVRQREEIPQVYGEVDFSIVPERYDADAGVDDERFASMRRAIERVFDQPETMRVIRDATMTGDRLATRTPARSRSTASSASSRCSRPRAPRASTPWTTRRPSWSP